MNNCKIVKDLLPTYIDNLTSEETTAFIENHMKECNECRKTYEKMKREVMDKEFESEQRKVNGFKKINTKMRILSIILIIVLAALLVSSIRDVKAYKEKYNKQVKVTNQISYAAELYAENVNRPPQVCYAIIDEVIKMNDTNEARKVKITGTEINDSKYQGKFQFTGDIDSYPKIMWKEKEVKITDLKPGQRVMLVIDIGTFSDPTEEDIRAGELPEILNVEYVIVLDDKL